MILRQAARLGMPTMLVVLSAACGCRKSEPNENIAPPPTESAALDILVFPPELHVEDRSVNEFLRQVMAVCAAGDYEEFRLLWSARERPLTRAEFETGWDAVQEIRILALEQVALAPAPSEGAETPQAAYAAFAEVKFDPKHRVARGEPDREVALLIVSEYEKLRITRAPKQVRDWLKDRVAHARPPEGAVPLPAAPTPPAADTGG